MEPIENPDTENTSVEYWNEILKSYGLSMSAGSPSRRVVSHVGTIKNCAGIDEEQFRKDSGQVQPTGKGPDS